MTWRVSISAVVTPTRFVVVRAMSEAGQVFVEYVKDASQHDAAIATVRDYCVSRGWELTS